jgi:predicted small lipoprotein YifL
VLAAIGVAMLAGCGQKGPLYLPDSKSPVVDAPASTPTGGTPPAPETRDEEKEKPR